MKHRKMTMRKSTTRLLVGGAAGLVALGAVGGAALATGSSPLQVTDASYHATGLPTGTQPGQYRTSVALHAMPVGTVSFHTTGTTIEATISASGLTPGSTHIAVITSKGSRAPIVFSPFTANSEGQVGATIQSVSPVGWSGRGTFQIELSTAPNQPIAVAPVGGASLHRAVSLQAVETSGYGQLAGEAGVDYNSQAKTLTVTVDASGFAPYSSHAAHIHAGSCASQGPVLYMLQDLNADAQGRIHQTDVLQGVSSFTTPAAGWYLNIHEGSSATILDAQGNPTTLFRPLLCSDLPPTASPTGTSGGGQSGQGGGTAPSQPTGTTPQGSAPSAAGQAQPYTFQTLDNPADPTFNQLLGINDRGVIAGYFGSGAAGHPNKGYLLPSPYSSYLNENFPGSVQTQVTGLNNRGYTVGFWADANNDNFGFAEHDGQFTTYQDPETGTGTVNQLLGVNDQGTAVGFYTDSSGVNHAYEVNLATRQYTQIQIPGGTNTVATGINDFGTVTGYSTNADNVTFGWVLKYGHIYTFDFPGSTNTTPLGINYQGEVVGSYVDAAGNTHGFTLTDWFRYHKFATVNDPNGVNSTTVNGVNDRGQLVGFYTDADGNTDGFIANK